jgi:hypothetical protein
MKMIVEGINGEPDVALVRLWILESEDWKAVLIRSGVPRSDAVPNLRRFYFVRVERVKPFSSLHRELARSQIAVDRVH